MPNVLMPPPQPHATAEPPSTTPSKPESAPCLYPLQEEHWWTEALNAELEAYERQHQGKDSHPSESGRQAHPWTTSDKIISQLAAPLAPAGETW